MLTHNAGVNTYQVPHKDNELWRVYEYYRHRIATATMAAVDLNIYRPSLCRRKRELEKAGLLAEVKKGICPITRHRASYLTTNPDLFPVNAQLSLFEAEEGQRA